MNTQRAQEIASSADMAKVTYNGAPIYIQNVDENNETARIYYLDEPQNEQEVPISSLNRAINPYIYSCTYMINPFFYQ